jgi:hypothetical protein
MDPSLFKTRASGSFPGPSTDARLESAVRRTAAAAA